MPPYANRVHKVYLNQTNKNIALSRHAPKPLKKSYNTQFSPSKELPQLTLFFFFFISKVKENTGRIFMIPNTCTLCHRSR